MRDRSVKSLVFVVVSLKIVDLALKSLAITEKRITDRYSTKS